MMVFCWIKEMCSTRETSRAEPNGCRCQMGQIGQVGSQASPVPMELRRTALLARCSGLTKNNNSLDAATATTATKATTATTATWERGMQQVLARFWARRSGRGIWLRLLSLLFCFTHVAATPSVVSLRFQTGTPSTDTTVDANASVGNVRLESEVLWICGDLI